MSEAAANTITTDTDQDYVNGTNVQPSNDTDVSKAKQCRYLKPWKPGQSGNPKGRPKGIRNATSEAFLLDLKTVWEKRGKQVLEAVAKKEPAKLLAAMVQVLPKDFQINVDVDQIHWVINASPTLTADEWCNKHNADAIEHDVERSVLAVKDITDTQA